MAEYDLKKLTAEARKQLDLMPTRVIYDAPWIRFRIDNKLTEQRNVADLSRLFEAHAVDFYGEYEEEFTVLDFTDSLWLVPNLTPLWYAHSAWRDKLIANRGFFRADFWVKGFPKTWPRSSLFGIKHGYLPKASVVSGNQLPQWKLEGPLDPQNGTPLSIEG